MITVKLKLMSTSLMKMRCSRAWGLQPQWHIKELEHLTGLPNLQSSHEPPTPYEHYHTRARWLNAGKHE